MKKRRLKRVLIAMVILFVAGLYVRSKLPEDLPLVVGIESLLDTFAVSSDSRYVVTVGGEHLAVYDRFDRVFRELTLKPLSPSFVFFVPDSSQLIVGGYTSAGRAGSIQVWDVATSRIVKTLVSGQLWASAAALSPDGRFLAYGGKDGRIVIHDIATNKPTDLITPVGRGQLESLAISADGKQLGAAYRYLTDNLDTDVKSGIFFYDIPNRKMLWSQGMDKDDGRIDLAANTIAISPDGVTLALAGTNEKLGLYDTKSGNELHMLTQPQQSYGDGTHSIDFSPDGKLLAWSGYQIDVWNVSDGSIRSTLNGRGSVKFSSDGSYLIAYSKIPDVMFEPPGSMEDYNIRLWKSF